MKENEANAVLVEGKVWKWDAHYLEDTCVVRKLESWNHKRTPFSN